MPPKGGDLQPRTLCTERCSFCGKSPSDGTPLRYCKGCRTGTMYCGKECQRKHWPSHKLGCHPPSERNIPMQTPHDSFKDAQHALLNFVDMHSWAFETAAKVLSLLAFGPNYLSQLKTTMVRFHLGVEKHIDRNVSPNGLPKATAKLTILSLDFMPHAELVGAHPADYSLASLTAKYHTTTEQIGRYWVSRGAPPPDGVVQLAFTINDSQPLVHSIAERRARAGHPPIESPMVRAALEDLLTMCIASANTDLPFRCMSTPIAVPGHYCVPTAEADAMAVVSARGTGTKTGMRNGARASVKRQPLEWVPLFEDWKAYLSGRTTFRERLAALEGLSTGHTPEQLIQMLLDFEQQPSYRTFSQVPPTPGPTG